MARKAAGGAARQAAALRHKSEARSRSVRGRNPVNDVASASIRGKRIPVVAAGFGKGTLSKRPTVQQMAGKAAGTDRMFVSAAGHSLQPVSKGQRLRTEMASRKRARRKHGVGTLAGEAKMSLKRSQLDDRGRGDRVRARRAGLVKSKGGATGRRRAIRASVKGSGFVAQLAAKGARDPQALAAWIGRRKYGAARFTSMARRGR